MNNVEYLKTDEKDQPLTPVTMEKTIVFVNPFDKLLEKLESKKRKAHGPGDETDAAKKKIIKPRISEKESIEKSRIAPIGRYLPSK